MRKLAIILLFWIASGLSGWLLPGVLGGLASLFALAEMPDTDPNEEPQKAAFAYCVVSFTGVLLAATAKPLVKALSTSTAAALVLDATFMAATVAAVLLAVAPALLAGGRRGGVEE